MDALTKARQVLARRVADPKLVLMPDLKADLRAVLEGFDEIERRTALLAAVVLQKHYWPTSRLRRDEINELARFGTDAAAAQRIAEHGANCVCELCFRGG